MQYFSLSLVFAALVAYTCAQRPAIASSWRFGRMGKVINFAQPNMDLQKICYAITAAYTSGQLSDAMGSAMAYFHSKKIPATSAAKAGSGMQCLYQWASKMHGSGEAANLFGDLYDTVIEGPHMRGFFQNDPCADPLFCQCGMMVGLDPPTAMAQMAMPMNNLIAPMAPLGMCVKKQLCARNNMDWRCNAAGRNPMASRMGRGMGGMPGMGGMTQMGRRGMNPMQGAINKMSGMNAMQGAINKMAGINAMQGAMNKMGGMNGMGAMNKGTNMGQGVAPTPAAPQQPQNNMAAAPAQQNPMTAPAAPAQPTAPAQPAAPAQNNMATSPAQNGGQQNNMGSSPNNMMAMLMSMMMSNPQMGNMIQNPNFQKTFANFMMQNMAPQQQQSQAQSFNPLMAAFGR